MTLSMSLFLVNIVSRRFLKCLHFANKSRNKNQRQKRELCRFDEDFKNTGQFSAGNTNRRL
jgi:hypothetical protein